LNLNGAAEAIELTGELTDHLALHTFDAESTALAEKAFAYIIDRVSRVSGGRLADFPAGNELAAMLDGVINRTGLGSERAFDLFAERVASACVNAEDKRFFAFVGYSPAVSAVLFDAALSAAAVFGTSWLEGAGATAAENQAIRWLADLAWMPASAGGVFLSGGTIANVNGLALARHDWRQRNGDSGRRLAIAATAEVHSSVRVAAKALEIDLLPVPADDRGRMTGVALAAALDSTAAEVCGVAATGGITNLGIVDDLAGIAAVAIDRGLWFHVDAAYGGAALVSDTARSLFAGIEAADSLVIDPHKWLFAPFDCSALIYREPRKAVAAFTQTAAYIEAFQETDDINPGDLALHLTRRARGLPFWFTLVAHGSAAMTAAVDYVLDLTQQAAARIDALPYLELLLRPELSVVVFRRSGWGAAQNRAWCARMLQEGTAMVQPTTFRGESVLRFCFVNPRTTPDDVQLLLDLLAGEAE
jgi:L-2,4-diaminobutyrate decarboxylase